MGFFLDTFGFKETRYDATRTELLKYARFHAIPPDVTHAAPYPRERCDLLLPDGRVASAGTFSFPSVAELRAHVANRRRETTLPAPTSSAVRVSNVAGESRGMHSLLGPRSAVVQAASQFNLLEFPSPSRTPEDGISAYVMDHTQGPACAVAAAAGTAYRNYLVPVEFEDVGPSGTGVKDEGRGQTRHRQLNGLAEIEDRLVQTLELQRPPWKVKNGYIDSTRRALRPVNEWLTSPSTPRANIDALTSLLRIGVQEDATITDLSDFDNVVTQTYNSAVSVGYSRLTYEWEPLARLVLLGSYEATILVGALKALGAAAKGKEAPPILLTKVGGGVFANKQEWIADAIENAVERAGALRLGVDLDVRIVHYGSVGPDYEHLERSEPSGDGNEEHTSDLC